MDFEKFGSGHLDLHGIDLHTASQNEIAEYVAERAGCPNGPAVIEERGAEVMAHRFGQIIEFYRWTVEEVRGVRPDIATSIESPLKRLSGEPLADFDPKWIPPENLTHIPGTETPWGYALPRLITYYIYDSKTPGSTIDRMVRALGYFDTTLRELTPQEGANRLLVKYAEKLTLQGKADPKAILKNTISDVKLKQDSFFTYFREIGYELRENAPVLWDTYSRMSPAEKTVLRIAKISGRP